jgi:hypothetical protein
MTRTPRTDTSRISWQYKITPVLQTLVQYRTCEVSFITVKWEQINAKPSRIRNAGKSNALFLNPNRTV